MRDTTSVLFLHSQNAFGADSAIHAHLARHLDRKRFTVHVACSRGDTSGIAPALAKFRHIPDISLRPTDFAPGFRHRTLKVILRQLPAAAAFPFDFAALARYVRREGIRVIHSTDRPRDAAYAIALSKVTGAKSVVHVHVEWSEFYSAPAKFGVRHASGVFGISRFVTDSVVATGTPRERVYTILNGIDPSGWDPTTDGSAVRRELGVPPNAPLLASVSRLFAQKGQRELLQALARVRREIPDVWLLVVGADAVEVHGGSFTSELRALARELGVADRVIFTGGRSDVPQIMAACDVFSMPSVKEPFGLVFLEAMAMQKAVVAINDGGTPEVVEDGKCGLLAPARDIEALARNIVVLLKDPGKRAEMGAYGRSRVLDYFNAERMARDAGDAYDAVLAR
jgi:glycosyltransferase involved in cell wall biosynthesis